MRRCELGHEEISYEVEPCPLCDALRKLIVAEAEVGNLEDDLNIVKKELSESLNSEKKLEDQGDTLEAQVEKLQQELDSLTN